MIAEGVLGLGFEIAVVRIDGSGARVIEASRDHPYVGWSF